MEFSQLLRAARQFERVFAQRISPVLERCELTMGEIRVLLFLANNPENSTAKEICAMRHLKPGIVSLHVDTLATLGLLERKSVPGDRRKLRLVPTEKAGAIIARGRAMQEAFAKTLAQGLSEEELACFVRCMETISQNLERAAELTQK